MKMSCTAVMKRIKELDERKNRLMNEERERCETTYVSEKDKVDTGYDYARYQQAYDEIDGEVRRLKGILNRVNATVKLKEYGMTIGEALVYLAQLSSKRARLEALPTVQSSRRVTYNGVIEYTVCNFDTETVKRDVEAVRTEIGNLQMAIDRVNLTHTVEV